MGRKFDKFLLLMWKNWILQIRHPVQTAFEILVPVFFCAILVVIRSLVSVNVSLAYNPTPFDPSASAIFSKSYDEIVVSPKGPAVEGIVNSLKQSGWNIAFTYQPSSKSLENYLIGQNSQKKLGVAFDDALSQASEFPKKVEFTISWYDLKSYLLGRRKFGASSEQNKTGAIYKKFPAEIKLTEIDSIIMQNWETELIYPPIQFDGPRYRGEFTAAPDYYNTGFLTLQKEISELLIDAACKPPKCIRETEGIWMQRFPYPATVSDPLLQVLQLMIGVIIVLSFVYSAINIIKVIAIEKETQLKEAMKIMGLPSWIHWLAWFTKSIIFMLVSIILMIVLLKTDGWYDEGVNSIFPKCDPTLLFVFFLLYACTIITYCFMVSVFFNQANLASGIGGMCFFLLLVPYTLLQMKYQELSLSTKLLSSLLSNTAMAYGFQLLCIFEGTEEGQQWNNLFNTATPDDNLTMGHVFLMLIVDSVIYMLIALYVEAIFPGKYGVPKKWHFIFTWMLKKKVDEEDYVDDGQLDAECFEGEPGGYAGVKIHKLRKVYGKDKVAVRNLTLNMYENQITALLGHNGAGKTTTMSMLTGMYTPTSGTAVINNFDIRTDIGKVRSSLGLCPQHNILFEDLTVAEHIKFYSKLKGLPKDEIDKEIDLYVNLLRLNDKRNKQASTLSGGMKRKLSVAVALCGKSKVVMLDEPTAGMDPAARRALWELVESQKKGRTIMLTTHFMDEADLLGDRIAIMAGGKLQCCGSSFFLKKRYGAGYHLIMDKNSGCDVAAITRVMKTFIPDIEVQSNIGSELTYLLNEKDSPCFKDMLQSIETRSQELGIRSYGISLTTLEDVFLRVGADHGQEELNNLEEAALKNGDANQTNQVNHAIEATRSTEILISSDNDDLKLTGFMLQLNHIQAMFMKRFLTTIRSYGIPLVQLVMPIILLSVSIVSGRLTASSDLVNLPITLNSYNKPIVALQTVSETNPYFQASKQWITEQKKTIRVVENIPQTIYELRKREPSNVRLHYQIGIEFRDEAMVGWFNNDPYHTPPLILNQMMNAVLKRHDPEREIKVNNYPMPYRLETRFQLLQQGNNIGFQLAMNIGFLMAFISAFYTLSYIKERVCKAKHLQIVSGANVIIFWTVSYIWDWLTYFMTIIVILVTLVCFQEDGFKTWDDFGHLVVILLYFGFAMFPMVYLSSLLFDTPAGGYTRVVLFSVVFGIFGFVVVEILNFEELELTHVAKPMDWIFLIVPHYALAAGIRNVDVEFSQFKICKQILQNIPKPLFCAQPTQYNTCCYRDEDYYAWDKPGILRNIVVSIVVGFVGIAVLLAKEYKVFAEIGYAFQKKTAEEPAVQNGDEDVAEEANKIKRMSPGEIAEQSLVLLNVSKQYKKFKAVNNLCLGVNSSECFGLLGVNGAGKTTTFKMITGDTRITQGDVFVKGLNLKKQISEVNKLIGYCPQFDALLEDLTGRETIKLFALLRGYREPFIRQLAQKLAMDFDFVRHIDKKVKEMSGGNKRKLSTAVALIGDPPILYLDEPTTGMDPGAKRFLWNALCKIRDSGKCLILTSHSMEECEALCTRLAIMVNGTFKCLGSTQHLKNKFSQGYTLTVKLGKSQDGSPVSSGPIEEHVVRSFPTAVLRERHQELVTFYIPDTTVTWSSMFGVMEDAKKVFNIEDYSLGQSTLEQVFLTFTNQQIII